MSIFCKVSTYVVRRRGGINTGADDHKKKKKVFIEDVIEIFFVALQLLKNYPRVYYYVLVQFFVLVLKKESEF